MVVIAETQIIVEIHPAIAVERKIGRHHIAFFRTTLLGMDMSEISDRYLETWMDLRRAKATLVWTQNTLLHAALRRIKPSFVLIKLSQIIGSTVLELLIFRGHERIKTSDKF